MTTARVDPGRVDPGRVDPGRVDSTRVSIGHVGTEASHASAINRLGLLAARLPATLPWASRPALVVSDIAVDSPFPGLGLTRAGTRGRVKAEVHNVQYLRALAAIGVLCYHVSEEFHGDFKIGAAGVDLFFVISGFIMWVTTADRQTTPQRFAWRRVTRIVPLYWIVTGVTALGILVAPQFFFGHVLTLVNLVGSLVFLPAIRDGAFHPVAIQGWTLCYEMMFYTVFALALLLKQGWRPPAIFALFGVMTVLHHFLSGGYLRQYTDPIILEFVAGILIGVLWTMGRVVPGWLALLLLIAGVSTLIASQFVGFELPRVLRWGMPAAAIVAGAILLEKNHPRRSWHMLGFLGDASYSIYLWHVLLASVATWLVLRLHLPLILQPPAIFAICLSVALLLYLSIEKPLIRLLRSR